jgi:GH35 family endo-1,4-beta-xylanase
MKALSVRVLREKTNPWDIEVTYPNVLVNPNSTYSYRIWVKGDLGMKGNFTVGTPAPGYVERARQNVVFTGDWQEITLIFTTNSDDKWLRLATHLSLSGNVNKTVYFDELSFTEMTPLAVFSPVTVTQLAALSPNGMPMGVAVPAGMEATSVLVSHARKTLVQNHFNQITAENVMKMGHVHPEPNTYVWDDADALVAYAKAQGLSMHGHTLVWHNQTASWMQAFEGTKAQWITMLDDHVKTVATHFEAVGVRDVVMSWDVVNEAFMEDGGYRGQFTGESIWYKNIGAEFIERAFMAARSADPDALLYYNDYNLVWSDKKLNAVLAMVQDFKNRNIPIDGVGFQAHLSLNSPTISTIRAQFRRVMAVRPKIKLKITELDVRLNNLDSPINRLTPEMAEAHKRYVYEIVRAYLQEVPEDQRGGISVWGITDADSWILGLHPDRLDWPLLFNADFTPKPALQGFADALNEAS